MTFVAPKNFKRGRLIANKYTVADLLIAGAGILASLALEILFLTGMLSSSSALNLGVAILFFVPAGVSILFIVPNGIYHNIFTFGLLFLQEMFSPKKYIWKGVITDVCQKQDKETSEEGTQE